MAPKADYILDHLNAGDMVLTLGAGDIWKTGEELLARLQNQAARPESEARMKKNTVPRPSRLVPQRPGCPGQEKPGSSPGGAPRTVTAATGSRESPGKPGSGA